MAVIWKTQELKKDPTIWSFKLTFLDQTTLIEDLI